MSTEHTFEVGDVVRSKATGLDAIVESVRGDKMTLRWSDGSGGRIAHPQANHNPVVVSAEHVGRRARITDQDGLNEYRGHRGVVHLVRTTGVQIICDDDSPRTADPGCAILVADEPTPAAEPDTSTLRGRVEVAVWGTVHVASEAAAAVDAVMDVVDAEVQRLLVDLDRRREQVVARSRGLERAAALRERLRRMLDRDRRALARVKTQRDQWQKAADHVSQISSLALRQSPDSAAGLTVTPDGQRVVDADGRWIVGRGQRTATHLHADADSTDRVAAALRLLADHAEAAEATPTVDEDAEAVHIALSGETYADAVAALNRLAAAARAARTGDGA